MLVDINAAVEAVYSISTLYSTEQQIFLVQLISNRRSSYVIRVLSDNEYTQALEINTYAATPALSILNYKFVYFTSINISE